VNKFIYHIVPGDVEGRVLYPLNETKERYPSLYERLMEKYIGRERLLSMYIPPLDCSWSDVLHMSPVHPDKVVRALAKAGIERGFGYYEIDPATLDQSKLLIYKNEEREIGKAYDLQESDFAPFKIEDLSKWDYIPDETIDYYKRRMAEGKPYLIFRHIPHVLYKGQVDVRELDLKTTKKTHEDLRPPKIMDKRDLIEKYIDGWIKDDQPGILSTLSPEVIIIESHGPKYTGIKKVEEWARKWFEDGGSVNKWEIVSFYDVGETVFFEWIFECFADGTLYNVDGISIVKFEDDKISYMREYKTSEPIFEWTQ
jgi:hypothetical protein